MADYNEILHWFGTVRNEFQNTSLSVFNSFVVPFDIASKDLNRINHSMALVGGRGSGKTVFLKYFSHWTQFDEKQQNLTLKDLDSVILYWKPDTAFCRVLRPETYGKEYARDAFLTLAGFEILNEFIFAIKNIGVHFPEASSAVFSDKIFWKAISKILGEEVNELEGFLETIDFKIYEMQSNPKKLETPATNPKSIIEFLVKRVVRVANSWFENTTFKIFVDEFENLRQDQQVFINDYRKHSDARISWNVAYKEYASVSVDTTGDEKLQEVNDYTKLRIFSDLNDESYKVLSAEIILNVFLKRGRLKTQIKSLSSDFLCDENNLNARKDKEYRKSILSLVNSIFPQPSVSELCGVAAQNSSVMKKVLKSFNDVGFPEKFARSVLIDFPQVAIAHTVIFYHKTFQKNLEEEKQRFVALIESGCKKEDKAFFTKVNTYSFAALLSMNIDNTYINIPVYSGFDRFCLLSSNSIRNVISLVFNTAKLANRDASVSFSQIEEIPPFSYEEMQMGALVASEESINEIINFTPLGIQLSSMTNRLGNIFKLMHKIKGVSEPEISHFSLKGNYKDLPENLQRLIETAKSWRILIESSSTKDRDPLGNSSREYTLNPIYAPYFGISYRKIRKLEFSLEDFEVICSVGDEANKSYGCLRGKFEELVNDSEIRISGPSQSGWDW